MNSVEINNLCFSYGENLVLNDINLNIEEGEFVAIIGSNGSGKSTLIKNLLGELKPQNGMVKVLEKEISDYKNFRDIGYVPQVSIVGKVTFPITVREMVALNLYEEFGFFKFPKKTHYDRVDKILEYLGLIEYKKKPVNELSGGLQQRTMIARAMINNPRVLILDEPTAGVDEISRHSFLKSIKKLNEDRSLTIVLVTHDLDEVLSYAKIDKVYEIINGNLVTKFAKNEVVDKC